MSITSNPRRFDYLSWPNAAEAAKKPGATLVWPFGACEQHGPHLPLATDNIFSEKIIESVLKKLPEEFPIWMLPSQLMGFSPEHQSFKGTISLSANLLLELVKEVGGDIAEMGFRRLVLFNSHGGQIGLLQSAARELRVLCPQMAVLPCFLWSGVNSLEELIPQKEMISGLHAGFAETSLMLSIYPELVGIERPADGDHISSDSFATPPEGWTMEGHAPCAWLTSDISKTGVIGDSSFSSSDVGNLIENRLVSHWETLFTSLMNSSWPPVSYKKNM